MIICASVRSPSSAGCAVWPPSGSVPRTGITWARNAAACRAKAGSPSSPMCRPASCADSLWRHDTSPSNRLLRDERREQVMAALAELSPRDREVLVMRHFEQLSTAEIAEAVGATEISVRARLCRALYRIRGKMEEVIR